MRKKFVSSLLVFSVTAFAATNSARADATSDVQTFASQMGSWNVVTSGAFSTDNHVHGGVAVGGNASLSGNAEINSHGSGNAEALRVYGNLNLSGSNNKVLAGGATVVKNGAVNTGLVLKPGQPNPNQSIITSATGSLFFNGNGGNGVAPALNSLAAADSFFSSRDSQMQAANASLLSASGALAPTSFDADTIYFNAANAGVSVFNWNIDTLTNINEVGFNLGADAFVVINIVGSSFNSTWNAGFNFLGGNDSLATRLLWNIGVATVNLTGSELFGSILAPDSTINSGKQLTGSLYAASLHQRGQQIHQGIPYPPQRVPESSSVLVLVGFAFGVVVLARRFLGAPGA